MYQLRNAECLSVQQLIKMQVVISFLPHQSPDFDDSSSQGSSHGLGQKQTSVGTVDGDGDGITDGDGDGTTDGDDDGLSVGTVDGDGDGSSVDGNGDGTADGDCVGSTDGTSLVPPCTRRRCWNE